MSRASKERRRKRHAEQAQLAQQQGENGAGEAEGAHTPTALAESGKGQGELLADPHHTRADSRLINRAVREGWDIPEEAFEVLPQRMYRIAKSDDEGTREQISATKALLTMAAQNQSSKPRQVDHRHAHIHVERREQLGNEEYLEQCLQECEDVDTTQEKDTNSQ